MNYIYDILLNFKDELYDFYEWNKEDNIIHIRKIPIIKISEDDLYNIKNNYIQIDESFLEKIKNKTEIFTSKNIKKIEYACLLTDSNSIIAINRMDKKIKRSSLLIDEELDSLNDIDNLKIEKIKYDIIKKINYNEFKTRKQIEITKYIKKEFNKIKKEEDKLKYIYYDCFNKKEDSIEKIIDNIENKLDDINICNKLYKFFKLTKIHK